MEYRRLGKSSLVVSAMGLGCMGMSQSYGTPDDTESIATVHHALDQGLTFLDTADFTAWVQTKNWSAAPLPSAATK